VQKTLYLIMKTMFTFFNLKNKILKPRCNSSDWIASSLTLSAADCMRLCYPAKQVTELCDLATAIALPKNVEFKELS